MSGRQHPHWRPTCSCTFRELCRSQLRSASAQVNDANPDHQHSSHFLVTGMHKSSRNISQTSAKRFGLQISCSCVRRTYDMLLAMHAIVAVFTIVFAATAYTASNFVYSCFRNSRLLRQYPGPKYGFFLGVIPDFAGKTPLTRYATGAVFCEL